jgi:hypothetical protein
VSRRHLIVWVAANIGAAVVLGLIGCHEAWGDSQLVPWMLPGFVFGAAQAAVLAPLSRGLVAWLPVTAAITPIALFLSALAVSKSMSIGFDTPSPPPSSVGPVEMYLYVWPQTLPGWIVLGIAQALVLRLARFAGTWVWIPALAIAGAGLLPFGARAVLSPPDCPPLSAVTWGVGGTWHAAVTAIALRHILRSRGTTTTTPLT